MRCLSARWLLIFAALFSVYDIDRENKKNALEKNCGSVMIEKGLESAGVAALHLSVGGNRQSDSWYRSNVTPFHLAALALVHIQHKWSHTAHVYAQVRGFGCLCRTHGEPVGVAGL